MRKASYPVIIAVLLCVGCGYAFAQDSGLASDYLCRYGIKLYKEGNVNDAIHELRKSLNINPNNALARKYLDKILSINTPPAATVAVPQEIDNRLVILQKQIADLKTENQSYLEQLNALKEAGSLGDSKIARLNSDIDEARALLKLKGEEAAAKDAQIKELQDKIGIYTQMTDERVGQLLSAKDSKIKELETEINDISDSRQQENETQSATAEKLSAENVAVLAKLNLVQKEADLLKEQLTKAKVQLQKLQEDNSKKDAQIKAAENKAIDYSSGQEKQVSLLSGRIKDLESDFTSAKGQSEKLKAQLLKSQEDNSAKDAQLKAAEDKGISAAAQEKQLNSLSARIKEQEAGLASGKAEKEAVLAKLNLVQKEADLLKEQLTKAKVQLQKLQEDNSAKNAQLKAVGDKASAQLKDKESTAEEFKRDSAAAQGEIRKLKGQIDESGKSSAAQEKQLSFLSEKVKELEATLTSTQDNSEKLKSQIAKLQEDNSAKDTQLKTAEDKAVSVGEKIDNLNKQVSAANKDIAEKDAAIRKLQNDTTDIQQELAATKDWAAELQKKIIDAGEESVQKDAKIEDLLKKINSSQGKVQMLVAEKEDTVNAMEAEIAELNKTMDELRKGLQSEIDNYQAKLELAQRGIVVNVLTDVLFNSGSAQLSGEGKIIIDKVAKVLSGVDEGHHIIIEGHTDNEPIKFSKWKSNWDLSCARAISVLQEVVRNSKVTPERLSVSGFGEYSPIADNSSDDGRKQNRRVEIIIQPKIIKIKDNL